MRRQACSTYKPCQNTFTRAMLRNVGKTLAAVTVGAPVAGYCYAQTDEGLQRVCTAFTTLGSIQTRFEWNKVSFSKASIQKFRPRLTPCSHYRRILAPLCTRLWESLHRSSMQSMHPRPSTWSSARCWSSSRGRRTVRSVALALGREEQHSAA